MAFASMGTTVPCGVLHKGMGPEVEEPEPILATTSGPNNGRMVLPG